MTQAADAAAAGYALSPAEQAYFDSKGEATEGLGTASVTAEAAVPADAAPPGEEATNADQPPANDDKPKNPGQWVRHGALHAERERRKKVEAELAGERELR